MGVTKGLSTWMSGLAVAWALIFVFPGEAECQVRRNGFSITPRLTLTGQFNDNILLHPVDKEDDWIGILVPGLALGYEGPTFRAEAEYGADLRYYSRHPRLNIYGKDHHAGLDLSHRVTRNLEWTLSDFFSATTDPLRWAYRVDAQGNIQSRDVRQEELIQYISNVATAELGWQMSPLVRLELGFNGTLSRFREYAERQVLPPIFSESTSGGGRLGLEYTLTPSTTIEGDFRGTYYDISSRDSGGTAKIHGISVGMLHEFTSKWTARLYCGLSNSQERDDDDGEGGGEDQSWSETWQAGIDREFDRATVSLMAEQVVGGGGGLSSITRTRAVNVNSIYTIVENLDWSVLVRYAKSKSLSDTLPPGGGVDMETWFAGCAVEYMILDWLRTRVEYQFHRQVSLGEEVDLDVDPDPDEDQTIEPLDIWDNHRVMIQILMWLPEIEG